MLIHGKSYWKNIEINTNKNFTHCVPFNVSNLRLIFHLGKTASPKITLSKLTGFKSYSFPKYSSGRWSWDTLCVERGRFRRYPCDVCGFQFFDKRTVDLHKRRVHLEDLPWCCEQCGRTFVSQSYLNNHIKTSHRELKTKFLCPLTECKKICNTSGTLRYNHWPCCLMNCFNSHTSRYHILTHEKKTYQCNVCIGIFHHPFRLRRHIKKYHENNAKRMFQCNFCDLQLTTACSLKNHIRTHTGEKPFECQWCEKGFTTSQQLRGHRVVHTKEKPFACKICPKRFTQQGTLTQHVRSCHQVAETIVKEEHFEVDC